MDGVIDFIWKSSVVLASLAQGGTAVTAAPVAAPLAVQCTAAGAEHLTPAMAPDAICARFVAALGNATGRPAVASAARPTDGLVIVLTFRPRGLASAGTTRIAAGRGRAGPTHELAVTDRPLSSRDIDQLAADVAAGMRGT